MLHWYFPMKFGVVVFPGSNCDHDAWYAVSHNLGQRRNTSGTIRTQLGDVDAVILPGGFSYGDYLRCGAIAKFSPVMKAVKKFAAEGGLVLGICNGFQILVRSGLLPGALLRNAGLKFICSRRRPARSRRRTRRSPHARRKGQILRMPDRPRRRLLLRRRAHARRTGGRGPRRLPLCRQPATARIRDIAGILNRERNVLGMMPHPERAADPLMGSTDGLVDLRARW